MAKLLTVSVCSLSGEQDDFEVDEHATVCDLKTLVERAWEMPKGCQRILQDTTVLEDKQLLCELAGGASVLQLTVVVSFEQIYKDLSSKVPEKVKALQILGDMGPRRCKEDAVRAVCARLEDANEKVRSLAVKVLRTIATQNQRCAIEEVGQRLMRREVQIRASAADAMRQVAPLDLEQAVTVLGNCCQHDEQNVRCAALEVLQGVASRGNERALRIALAQLQDDSLSVRAQAFQAVIQLADKGEGRAIDAILERVLEANWTWQKAEALRLLPRFAERGSRRAVSGVVALLKSQDEEVRKLALQTLPTAALRGDEEAVSAAHGMLKDECAGVRHEAFQALSALAARGDGRALAAAVARLDKNSHVQTLAMEALGKVCPSNYDGSVPVGKAVLEKGSPIGGVRRKQLAQLSQRVRSGATQSSASGA